MALTVSQITAASYNDVRNEARKPANQWAENAFMRALESMGFIKQVDGGPVFEATVDYRRNVGAAFLATELTPLATGKTEVLTAAQYDPAELSVPLVFTRADEAKNPTRNQKVALSKSIQENGLNSHDELIEQALFASTTNGFLGMLTQIPDSMQSNTGGIDGAVEAWWRNFSTTYASAGTNMEAKMTTAWNAVSKGSGSPLTPQLIVSDGASHALFEGTQQSLQRYVDTTDAKAGFKTLGFKTGKYIFSQFGGTRLYFLNNKAFELRVVKGHFRDLGDEEPFPAQNAKMRKIYTMLQTVVANKSRLAVLTQV
jgi:hypothetical protein